MDRHFLEFWGNFLIQAAKGQEHMEDLAKWITQGLKGFEDLTSMFRKFYGLDRLDEENSGYLLKWEKAQRDFQRSLQDYLGLFGVVPKQEHLALVKKYKELREKLAEQEETIRHLRMLSEGVSDQGEVLKGFQDLVKNQTEQFQKFMRAIGKSFEKTSKGPDED